MIEVDAKNAESVAKAVKAGELPKPPASLSEAMTRVMADVPYVQKNGQMQGVARYSYAKESDFIAALHPALVRHGVSVAPVAIDVILTEAYETQKGAKMNRMIIRATYRFTHSGSKETLDVVSLGEGADSGDKCSNKCLTAALKYALRQAFVIETGNDPDETPSASQERQSAQEQAKPAPAKSLADQCASAIDGAKNRDELAGVWKQYEADMKANRFTDAERKALVVRFTVKGKAWPKPAKA